MNARRAMLVAVAFCYLAVEGAAAGPIDDAGAAFLGGDYVTALRLLRPLAEQHDPTAQTILGNMYDEGKGVPQDYEEAVKWYRLAAEQGFPQGQDNLGQMYFEGHGVPKNYVEAHKWFNLAASQSAPFGIHDRDLVASKMTPEQIAEAQRLAREWKPK
jgi:uncharacterized protein